MSGASSSFSVERVPDRRGERRLQLVLCGLISVFLHMLLITSGLEQEAGAGVVIRSRIQGAADRIELVTQARTPSPPQPKPQPEAAQPLREDSAESLPETAAKPGVQGEEDGGREGYLPAEMLSSRPEFPANMQDLLTEALDSDEAGRVVVTLLLGADGKPDRVLLEYSELGLAASQRFVERLESLRLSPGQVDGLPVKTRWRLEFTFSMVD